MNNDQQNNQNARGLPFPPGFNFGTTLQNVFRNINHAFASTHDNGDQGNSRDLMDDMPPLDSLNSVGDGHGTPPTGATSSVPHNPSSSSESVPANADVPPLSQPDSQRDDDEESMPDLGSVSDSSDSSDPGIPSSLPPQPDPHPVEDDHDSAWTDEEEAYVAPAIGTRRARVDDDGDDARDRRHPSERVGSLPPSGAPQNAPPQQPPPPRTPAGLFGALFGLGPLGAHRPGGDAPPEHPQPPTHTGEGHADPSSADNNAPGRAPRGAPIVTAGFTFTIPLFGQPAANGNRAGPAPGGQGVPPGMMGMDAAAREELLASFATFFQEFQAMEEGREDPERAKKLLAGLEVVPLGLVKRLERVGGAPGGHAGDAAAEGTPSGCAICWDTLLDAESDSFSSLQPSGGEAPQSDSRDETRTGGDAMDVDASTSQPDAAPSSLSSGAVIIISLPCAHVFHASCLLPWFTRARQATCPTCRFNIDPENLTYTPPTRRPFTWAPPAQPGDAANAAAVPADPQAAPQAPAPEDIPPAADTVAPAPAPEDIPPAADAAAPAPAPEDIFPTAAAAPPAPVPEDPPHATVDAQPATGDVPHGPVPPPPGQAGAGHGFNPFFGIPGVPLFSFPAIQIPLGPAGGQAPGDPNQGIDVLTIGLDMFVGVPPPQGERREEPRENAEGGDAVDNDQAGAAAAGGDGAANPNELAQDLQSAIENLFRTTQTIIPQVINGQGGPVPAAPGPNAPPADAAQPPPEARPVPEGAQPGAPPAGVPRGFPFPFHPNMFRPMRPMPPRRERKTWALPAAPGPSLRQRVEQCEREQGLRCSDTSCGVGPSDEDPYPEVPMSSAKQVSIRPLLIPKASDPERALDGLSVCHHAFHPECLVSAERVAGWGGDKTAPLVEVSCPVCRAVGCVTREEWESGVSAL